MTQRSGTWRRAVRAILAVAWTTALPAAVAGVPEAPRPGPLPICWAGWSNDSFGMELGANTDDYRTNAVSAALHLGQWVAAADHSMLTDRTAGTPLRCDQVSATLGWLACDGQPMIGGETWALVGVGARLTGDYGGQRLQNRWHDTLGYGRIVMPQDEAANEAIGYASGRWLCTAERSFGRYGIECSATALGSSGGQGIGTAGIDLVLLGVDGSFRLGVRGGVNIGTAPNATTRHVADQESGLWLIYGFSVGGWFLDGGWDPNSQGTMGTVGWMWGRSPARSLAGDISEMEGLIGVYQGYSLGVQYRFQPGWLRTMGCVGEHLSFLADYRFGRYPGVDWPGNTVVVRQPMVGVDVALITPGAGFSLVPFVYGGVGLRFERVRVTDTPALFPDQSATRAVIQGGAGLRFTWGAPSISAGGARYGMSLVYEGWLPLGNATATGPWGTSTYQDPHAGFGARMSASVPW